MTAAASEFSASRAIDSSLQPHHDVGDARGAAIALAPMTAAATAAAPGPAAAAAAAALNGFGPELSRALKSVVKIFATTASPVFGMPWQLASQTKSTATGFIVEPLSTRRILTNAHAVANQVQVMVRKHGSARKFAARVLAVGHECDIAMLSVDDDEFWSSDVQALPVNGLPAMQDTCTVIGFPTGGDNVSLTSGVVSRIDRQTYSHGRTALLTIQTDAAINGGNSGGPVLKGGQVVGIAFQGLTSADNIGYVIPVPVIKHFLEDLDRHGGRYTGFPEAGFSWQTLESADMRRYLGLPPGSSGVYVTKSEPLFDACRVLREGDVLTHFDGHAVADDGTFLFQQDVRIDFRHLVSMKFDGDVADVTVWRDGAAVHLGLKLSAPKHLVPIHSHDVRPPYFVFCGLVFTRLSAFYLRSVYGADWQMRAPIKLCDRYFSGSKASEDEEVVVLAKVLAAPANVGYQDLGNVQVLAVNGVRLINLAHLAALVNAAAAAAAAAATDDGGAGDAFVRFDLEWHKVVVVSTKAAAEAHAGILEQNNIPLPGYSRGLLEQPHPPVVPRRAAKQQLLSAPTDDEKADDEEHSAASVDGGDREQQGAVAVGASSSAAALADQSAVAEAVISVPARSSGDSGGSGTTPAIMSTTSGCKL